MSFKISSEKQAFYNEILRPTPQSSFTYKFFTTLDHKCIDVKKTYRGTEKTVVKIFKISIKIFALLLLNSVKLVLFITIITPLAFEAVSVCQNREITAGNKDLKRRAIALVKASEAYMFLGNVQTAVEEQSNQSQVIDTQDHTTPQAFRNTIHVCQEKARLHHNLMVTAQEWGDIVKDRVGTRPGNRMSSDSLDQQDVAQHTFDKNEFFAYAVTTLSAQGRSDSMKINALNALNALSAYLALTDNLAVLTQLLEQDSIV